MPIEIEIDFRPGPEDWDAAALIALRERMLDFIQGRQRDPDVAALLLQLADSIDDEHALERERIRDFINGVGNDDETEAFLVRMVQSLGG